MNGWAGRAVLVIAAAVLGGAAAAAAFVFDRVEVGLEGSSVTIDADISYRLSEEALEALANGVPLTFELHVQVRSADAWLWEADLVESRLRSLLRYHPLSSLYEVRDLRSGEKTSFATRAAALRELGQVRSFPVIPLDRLEAGSSYTLRMETYLDVDALPLPLRPLAYISPAWSLDSEVWEWRLQP
jgi:hypothetical protein